MKTLARLAKHSAASATYLPVAIELKAFVSKRAYFHNESNDIGVSLGVKAASL